VQIYSTKLQCKDVYIDVCDTCKKRRGENETMETGDNRGNVHTYGNRRIYADIYMQTCETSIADICNSFTPRTKPWHAQI